MKSCWFSILQLLLSQQNVSLTSSFVANTAKKSSCLKSESCMQMISTSQETTTSSSAKSTSYDVVKVDLDNNRDYPIYIGDNFSPEETGELLASHILGKNVLLITNDVVAPLYLEKYKAVLETSAPDKSIYTLVLPDGEDNKSLEVLQLILDKAMECNLDRKSTFIALGGGVIGDMVGFASAIYQRGVNFIQIPTTVMAMVDSSVGGKTGVNHPLGKNMIGAFHQPQCVFIDVGNLASLPDRELYSGISEIVKYGLIRDAAFFEWQEENMEQLCARESERMRYAIKRSCENKAQVVKEDEKEAGVRATLNLGHTFGHAIENGSGYGKLLHGEAVSIGIAMAASLSLKVNWIDSSLYHRIYAILLKAKLPVKLAKDSPMTQDIFLKLMSVDKKVANGKLFLILLQGDVGRCLVTSDFQREKMIEVIDEFVNDKE